MASLVDTNILVYSYDSRDPRKQRIAEELIHRGLEGGTLVIPHQAIVEFVAAATRSRADLGGSPILSPEDARREAELLTRVFPVLYPVEEMLLTALQGAGAYGLSWFDAHLWAYAQFFGIDEILSEDFEHGRHYGRVRVVDPFLAASDEVRELPPLYEEVDSESSSTAAITQRDPSVSGPSAR